MSDANLSCTTMSEVKINNLTMCGKIPFMAVHLKKKRTMALKRWESNLKRVKVLAPQIFNSIILELSIITTNHSNLRHLSNHQINNGKCKRDPFQEVANRIGNQAKEGK